MLQSLGICPKLLSFVMTILVKLISKQVNWPLVFWVGLYDCVFFCAITQVWKQPKVWQGFIRCCQVSLFNLPPSLFPLLTYAHPISSPQYSPANKAPLLPSTVDTSSEAAGECARAVSCHQTSTDHLRPKPNSLPGQLHVTLFNWPLYTRFFISGISWPIPK